MRTLTVTGSGIAPVAPDSAVVRVTAVHQAPTLSEALAGASSAGAAVTSVALSYVDSAALASRELTVWPAHDDVGRPSGFEARHGYTVNCPDLDVAGALVTELAAQVGDQLQVEGVSLEVSDTSAAVTVARAAAYADARGRAEHLSGLADVTLGDVQSLVEGAGAAPGVRGLEAMAKGDVVLEPGEGWLGQWLTVTWAIA